MEIAIIGGGIVGLGLADCIGQEELRALSDQYKRIAGYSVEELAAAANPPAT